jgi:hypothetical protein
MRSLQLDDAVVVINLIAVMARRSNIVHYYSPPHAKGVQVLASQKGKLFVSPKFKEGEGISEVSVFHNPLIHFTMRSIWSWLGLASLLAQAQALYFYIDGPTQKCFFEELPKDTLVVGTY